MKWGALWALALATALVSGGCSAEQSGVAPSQPNATVSQGVPADYTWVIKGAPPEDESVPVTAEFPVLLLVDGSGIVELDCEMDGGRAGADEASGQRERWLHLPVDVDGIEGGLSLPVYVAEDSVLTGPDGERIDIRRFTELPAINDVARWSLKMRLADGELRLIEAHPLSMEGAIPVRYSVPGVVWPDGSAAIEIDGRIGGLGSESDGAGNVRNTLDFTMPVRVNGILAGLTVPVDVPSNVGIRDGAGDTIAIDRFLGTAGDGLAFDGAWRLDVRRAGVQLTLSGASPVFER